LPFKFAAVPDIHRREIARQSLALRGALIPLFALVAIWGPNLSGAERFPITASPGLLATLGVYLLSSVLLAVGYWTRILGSADVVFLSLADTILFLCAGTYFTGGAASPVVFLFITLPAAYLVLATPALFLLATSVSLVFLVAAILLAQPAAWPSSTATQLNPGQNPAPFLLAAAGSLLVVGALGWMRSRTFIQRSQSGRHLDAVLKACRGSSTPENQDHRLASLLDTLMETLHITDEVCIYLYEPSSGMLRRYMGLGLFQWFQRFPGFRPGEGNVGIAFKSGGRVTSCSPGELEAMLARPGAGPSPGGWPAYTFPVPPSRTLPRCLGSSCLPPLR